MSFLTPLYILGLAAISLPVLFHLIRRTPKGVQPFSSLMFVKPTPPRLTRRSRLDQLLLLLLRDGDYRLAGIRFRATLSALRHVRRPVGCLYAAFMPSWWTSAAACGATACGRKWKAKSRKYLVIWDQTIVSPSMLSAIRPNGWPASRKVTR